MATDGARSPGFVARLVRAGLNRRFQVLMLGWCVLLTAILFLPDPAGLAVDTHLYAGAYHDMLAGRDAYVRLYSASSDPAGPGALLFRPPPAAALVAGPIASLPGGDWWWLAFNATAIFLAFLVVRSISPPFRGLDGVLPHWVRTPVALAAWFLFQPNIQELAYGNQQALVLLGFAAMAWGLLRGRPAVTGAGLALATLVKAWPALFLLPLLVGRRWREAAWFVAASALVVLASIPVVGIGAWVDFARAMLTGSANEMAGGGYNMAPLVALAPGVVSAAWIAATALGLAATGVLPPRRMLPAAIGVFLLLWPVVWMHYGGIALVAMVMLVDDQRLTPALASAWVLFAVRIAVAWLPATALVLAAAFVPQGLLRAQARLDAWLVQIAGATGTRPVPAQPADFQ